jgi:hypothetical protein
LKNNLDFNHHMRNVYQIQFSLFIVDWPTKVNSQILCKFLVIRNGNVHYLMKFCQNSILKTLKWNWGPKLDFLKNHVDQHSFVICVWSWNWIKNSSNQSWFSSLVHQQPALCKQKHKQMQFRTFKINLPVDLFIKIWSEINSYWKKSVTLRVSRHFTINMWYEFIIFFFVKKDLIKL